MCSAVFTEFTPKEDSIEVDPKFNRNVCHNDDFSLCARADTHSTMDFAMDAFPKENVLVGSDWPVRVAPFRLPMCDTYWMILSHQPSWQTSQSRTGAASPFCCQRRSVSEDGAVTTGKIGSQAVENGVWWCVAVGGSREPSCSVVGQ